MSLRGKFHLLLAIFGFSVIANVLVSIWCIHIYMAAATRTFTLLMNAARGVEETRRLTDSLVIELEDRARRNTDLRDTRYRNLARNLADRLNTPGFRTTVEGHSGTDDLAVAATDDARFQVLAARLSPVTDEYVALLGRGDRQQAVVYFDEEVISRTIQPIRRMLADAMRERDMALTRQSNAVSDQQALVTTILAGNAMAAFILAAIGVHLVRNWVLRPVHALKTAVQVHASGDLNYRLTPMHRDELGMLALAVNQMADSLVAFQRELVQKERMAAVGEVASTLAHNIRNPLAGIRASAQALMLELPEEAPARASLTRMIETVDSLNRWLRELLMVNRPIDLQKSAVPARSLAERVMAVARTTAQRRAIRIDLIDKARGACVQVDPARMEQALLAVVDNAIDASPHGGRVVIEIHAVQKGDAEIEFRVNDEGDGVAPEVRSRLMEAYVSTKPGGTGIGLHLTRKLVQAHGGQITCRDAQPRGTTMCIRLPADDLLSQEVNRDGPHPAR